MNKKVFNISDEQIKEMYLSGYSLRDISNIAQNTKGLMALRNKLHSLGIDTSKNMKKYAYKILKLRKKYILDDTVFDSIDTEEKAYWLGFLYADGYNHKSKNCIALRLQKEDIDVLYKFRNFLKTDSPIYSYRRKTRIKNIEKEYCELCVFSTHLCQTLDNLGCIQAKTYILEFPSFIPNNLLHHFMRGYFDGDGCISITKRMDRTQNSKNFQFTVAGRKEFIEQYQNILCKTIDITKTKINNFKNNFAVALHYSGKNNVIKIMNYLYKDCTIYMNRKYNKFKSCISVK